MYYFLFRHYSPATARWLTREPLGLDGPNLYHYGFGNPVGGWDIMGLSWYNPWSWNSTTVAVVAGTGLIIVGIVSFGFGFAAMGAAGGATATILGISPAGWFGIGTAAGVAGGLLDYVGFRNNVKKKSEPGKKILNKRKKDIEELCEPGR